MYPTGQSVFLQACRQIVNRMGGTDLLHIGTCRWNYDSWRGLVYPKNGPVNYLNEYSNHYSTVEVDQWFWSLFTGDTVVLPKRTVVADYAAALPDNFVFGIKAPNSITLTHHYNRAKHGSLLASPHFLSILIFRAALQGS